MIALDESRSNGTAPAVNLVKALIEYVNFSEALSDKHAQYVTLYRFLNSIWPGMHFNHVPGKFLHLQPYGLETTTSMFIVL